MVAAQLKSRFSWSLAVLDDPGQRISELGRDIVEEVLLVYYYRWVRGGSIWCSLFF
jgi:hypothetical protein